MTQLNFKHMSEVVVILMTSTVLLGQLSQCMLGSRCSQINTPCIQIKRDTVSEETMLALQRRQGSEPEETVAPGVK
jgi:hypothetical protein